MTTPSRLLHLWQPALLAAAILINPPHLAHSEDRMSLAPNPTEETCHGKQDDAMHSAIESAMVAGSTMTIVTGIPFWMSASTLEREAEEAFEQGFITRYDRAMQMRTAARRRMIGRGGVAIGVLFLLAEAYDFYKDYSNAKAQCLSDNRDSGACGHIAARTGFENLVANLIAAPIGGVSTAAADDMDSYFSADPSRLLTYANPDIAISFLKHSPKVREATLRYLSYALGNSSKICAPVTEATAEAAIDALHETQDDKRDSK